MKKPDWTRLAPPGTAIARERTIFLLCQGAAALYALSRFLLAYQKAKGLLYEYVDVEKRLIPGAVIAPFEELARGTMLLFIPALAALAALVLAHYLSYRRGSMSIYLMKRLPDKNLIHRQCWTLPLVGAALLVLTAILLKGIFYLIYWFATPAGCLPEVMGR